MSDFYKMDPAAWDFGTASLTLEQEAAYLRLINAMHKHKGPVPNIDRVLAGLFRTSTRKARALVDALIDAGKMRVDGDFLTNDRATSDLVHRGFVSVSRAESGAKGGRTRTERADKPLKSNDPHQAIASPREEKRREEKIGGGGDAGAREADPPEFDPPPDPPPDAPTSEVMTERELLLEAMGVDPASGITGPSGRMIGRMADMQTFEAWRNDLGLTTDEVLTVIREVMAPKRDGPPSTFSYFNQAMQRLAGDKAKPKLTPIEGTSHDRHHNPAQHRAGPTTAAGRAHQTLIAGFARALSEEP